MGELDEIFDRPHCGSCQSDNWDGYSVDDCCVHAVSNIKDALVKLIHQKELEARIDEHSRIKVLTEQAISWEQDGEGSGIQYFDSERLARLNKLVPSKFKPAQKDG